MRFGIRSFGRVPVLTLTVILALARRIGALTHDIGRFTTAGEPVLVRPRLGQGSFRSIVTDSYSSANECTGPW